MNYLHFLYKQNNNKQYIINKNINIDSNKLIKMYNSLKEIFVIEIFKFYNKNNKIISCIYYYNNHTIKQKITPNIGTFKDIFNKKDIENIIDFKNS
jgi:hypothetical protein